MIIDSRNELCDAVALNTGGAATYLIGSQIDLGAGDDPIGAGGKLYLVITVDTLPTSSTSAATAEFTLASDATAAVATDGSATEHINVGPFAISAMAAGAVLTVTELPQAFNYERFLGILQTTAGEAFTGGKINAFLTPDAARWNAYDSPAQA